MTEANFFLRHLAPPELAALRPELRRVALRRNEIVMQEAAQVSTVYLPIDCILSVITVMRDGRLVESRTIGRESGFGLLHALGSTYSYERVEVQIAGEAWTVPLSALTDLARKSPQALQTIASFAQATIIQSSVTLACNSLHKVESRLCRWLLLTQDRLSSDILPLTQEHLAIMLAVQRTTVTATASRLQDEGLIRYSRGKIHVLDRPGLLRASCECFEHIEDGVRRLIGEAPTPERGQRAASQ